MSRCSSCEKPAIGYFVIEFRTKAGRWHRETTGETMETRTKRWQVCFDDMRRLSNRGYKKFVPFAR